MHLLNPSVGFWTPQFFTGKPLFLECLTLYSKHIWTSTSRNRMFIIILSLAHWHPPNRKNPDPFIHRLTVTVKSIMLDVFLWFNPHFWWLKPPFQAISSTTELRSPAGFSPCGAGSARGPDGVASKAMTSLAKRPTSEMGNCYGTNGNCYGTKRP